MDTKTLYKPKNHSYHRNLSSVAPFFLLGKEKFLTGAGWCMASFPSIRKDGTG